MTLRVHLFPYRTQKLSSVVSKIVLWRRGVKIGRCQHSYSSIAQSVERMTVNHDVTGSSPVGGAKKNTHYQQLVLMTQGVHPFPYRTRKLSPVVPKIVVWRRAVKIGRCQHSIVSISLSALYGADLANADFYFYACIIHNITSKKSTA